MAFYAHIASMSGAVGSSPAGYKHLQMPQVSGILDTIISDLADAVASGTNNGWTLHDDLRNPGSMSGTLSPYYPMLFISNGIYGFIDPNTTNAWNFTSGSTLSTGYTAYNLYYNLNISNYSSSLTPISVDRVNWYNAWAPMWGGSGYSSATLDVPFAQASTHSPYVYQRALQWAVLKCQSSQRTFYVLIGNVQDRGNGPVLYLRVYEDWDAVNHVGSVNSSSPEFHWLWYMFAKSTELCRTMVWFLPEAFALWTGGTMLPNSNARDEFTYIGNLDTAGVRIDPYATAFIPGNMGYSGYGVNGNYPWQASGESCFGFQMMRTVVGMQPWGVPAYRSTWMENAYQLHPRMKPHFGAIDGPLLDVNGKFLMSDLDVYHVGQTANNWAIGKLGQEGRRGRLRHVKLPVGNPNMHAFRTVVADDGNTYMFVRMTPPLWTNSAGTRNGAALAMHSPYQAGANVHMMTGWAYASKSTATAIGEIYNLANGTGGAYRYLMVPINL